MTMTDPPVSRRRYQQLCLAVLTLSDPACRKPRGRLKQIRAMLQDNHIDLLTMAQACLDEVEREGVAELKRPMWRKATKRAARERRRRKR